jgi:hypothetical protein
MYSQKTLEMLVQDFISFDIYGQRTMLIQLLLDNNVDNLYIAYILYDILSNDKSNSANDQTKIYNSLNWNCKKYLKNALQRTVEYTNELLNSETSKISLEQTIYFMKANVNVKEKALQKLKELKSKSDDSGSKAKQYLDGLLKIPFNIYKEEEGSTPKKSEYIFRNIGTVNSRADHFVGEPLTDTFFRKLWYECKKEFQEDKGIEFDKNYTFHSCRAYFINTRLELGVPVSVVADLVGHTIKTMELHYKNHKLRKMTNQLVEQRRNQLQENDFLTFELD